MDDRLGYRSHNGVSFLEWVRIHDYELKKFGFEQQSEGGKK